MKFLVDNGTVRHELRFGCTRLAPSRQREAIELYIEVVELEYDHKTAVWHERARLSAVGRTLLFADGQIAAIACVTDRILVTSNTDNFQGFRGLRIRSWA